MPQPARKYSFSFPRRREMTGLLKTTGLAGILAAGILAAALGGARGGDTVTASQAVVTELGDNASATTYWVSTPDGWHVVTTVDTVFGRATATEEHTIVRFSSVLLPGQSQEISVPVALGAPQRVLVVRRL